MKSAMITTLLCLFLGTPAHGADPGLCPIEGEPTHWIADYCMAKLETDDEIPAGECIAGELRRTFPDDCTAKYHYKRALCGLALSRGGIAGDLPGCLADKKFVGPTVRNRGVGGASGNDRR